MATAAVVNFGATGSLDPIAYVRGYMDGLAGSATAGTAGAYQEGHALGTDVRAGRKPPPRWAVK